MDKWNKTGFKWEKNVTITILGRQYLSKYWTSASNFNLNYNFKGAVSLVHTECPLLTAQCTLDVTLRISYW